MLKAWITSLALSEVTLARKLRQECSVSARSKTSESDLRPLDAAVGSHGQ